MRKRIVYVHWNEAETKSRTAALERPTWEIVGHFSSEDHASLKDPLPDVLVISLDRLPSHGRAIAEWFWEAKKRQTIPILFVGGPADKVAALRGKFPAARYITTEELPAVLPEVLGEATSPVLPESKSRPTARKKSSARAIQGTRIPKVAPIKRQGANRNRAR